MLLALLLVVLPFADAIVVGRKSLAQHIYMGGGGGGGQKSLAQDSHGGWKSLAQCLRGGRKSPAQHLQVGESVTALTWGGGKV